MSIIKKANLDGVVESCLALNVLCVDIRAVLEQELAQLHALHAVDQAGASVIVGSLDVRVVGHLNFKIQPNVPDIGAAQLDALRQSPVV